MKVNEYFNGQVKSLGFSNSTGNATVGVMEAGEYEFSTGAPEIMTLISGKWAIRLPDSKDFKNFAVGIAVPIPANCKFFLRIAEESAYHCQFK